MRLFSFLVEADDIPCRIGEARGDFRRVGSERLHNGAAAGANRRDGRFNVITQWRYSKICDVVGGGESFTAFTKGEFDAALSRAQKSDRLNVIELKIQRNDASQQLVRVAAEVRKMRGTKNSLNRRTKPSRS